MTDKICIPIINLTDKYKWGEEYSTLMKNYSLRPPKKFLEIPKTKGHQTYGFYIEDEWRGIKYKATLKFDAETQKFKYCTIVIPATNQKFDIDEYRKTYELLVKHFGAPNIHKGLNIEELRGLKDLFSIAPDDLPSYIWQFEQTQLIHHFVDYWGNGPETILKPLKRAENEGTVPEKGQRD